MLALAGRIRIAALIEIAANSQGVSRKAVWERLHEETGIFCPFPTHGSLNTFYHWHRLRIHKEVDAIQSGDVPKKEVISGWWLGERAMRAISVRSTGTKEEVSERAQFIRRTAEQILSDPETTRKTVEDYLRHIDRSF